MWRPNYTIPSEENSSAATCGFLGELQAFAAAVRSGKTPPSDFRSAAGTLEAVEQLRRSIETMRLTCSSLSLFSATPEEAIAIVAELGFPAIDLVGIPDASTRRIVDVRGPRSG